MVSNWLLGEIRAASGVQVSHSIRRSMVRGTDDNPRAFGKFATTIVALTALATSLVFAQGATATMSGVVHDGTGAVIPAVTGTIKHTEAGVTRSARTARDGGERS